MSDPQTSATPPTQGTGPRGRMDTLVRPQTPGFPAAQRPGAAEAAQSSEGVREEKAKNSDDGRLIVGEGIGLKGEIAACDTLVVEGTVEASMGARVIEVAPGGTYTGKASVENARIAGKLNGELTVAGRLTVAESGRVEGKIRYGEIAIEAGGQIAGDIQVLSGGAKKN